MKKVFGFIGSPLKEKSNTYTLTKMMLDKLLEMDPGISHEILTAGHVNISYCKGCWSCMTKGHESCPLDKKDDMGILKRKMLGADFIIWGSPIYTAHMSGQMKTFLDRLAAWYHLMRLSGKPGLTVITTGSTFQEELHDFFGQLMGCLGIKVIARLDTVAYTPGVFRNPDLARARAEEAAKIIYPYITGEKTVCSDNDMEGYFLAMKEKVVSGKKWLKGDYEYWETNNMLELDSYATLLEKNRKAASPI